ncbi:DUF1877 family protein [Streptomyces sp. NPDC059688]|uniref:DUF1877 family protein n=1 Tax=Streptomyces sp. NPDC059688 TaxID=3346906 RepID=UPI0036AE7ED2
MSTYLRLRAVPPSALRNSETWLKRQFHDDARTAPYRPGRHGEEVLDERYADQERLYTGALPCRAEDRRQAHVVLGGRPVLCSGRRTPQLLVLTAAQVRNVAGFLSVADFDALWVFARNDLLSHYGGMAAENETRDAFAAAHQRLRAFYTQAAEHGDAVVKRLPLNQAAHLLC